MKRVSSFLRVPKHEMEAVSMGCKENGGVDEAKIVSRLEEAVENGNQSLTEEMDRYLTERDSQNFFHNIIRPMLEGVLRRRFPVSKGRRFCL